MAPENYFAGSFKDLKKHWDNNDRAKKFRHGQSRSIAVKLVLQRLETDIHAGSWLDIATGAGFVQTQVSENISPNFHVGLDFSLVMLRSHIDPFGERVLGTCEKLPFRQDAFSVISNFFSLSDYPEIQSTFAEGCRTLNPGGIICHVDYASGDEYWELRQRLHGQKKGVETIIGNLYLRTLDEILNAFPEFMRKTEQTIIQYKVSRKQFKSTLDLPDELLRKFLFSEFYKPRSK